MNFWKVTTFVLAALLAVVVGTSHVGRVSAEVQPNMQAALDSLTAAEQSLEKATPDKGGHRVKAMALTKKAIKEVNAGIAWDNAHKAK